MIDERFVLLALLLNLVGPATYLVRLVRGQVRPHVVTWTLWALAPYVAFLAQLGEGVGASSLITLASGTGPAAVAVAVVVRSRTNRSAIWSVTPFDLLCGGLSLVGLALWIVYRNAGFAIGLAIVADTLAAVPTYRKSLRDPRSESWLVYALLAGSAVITLATIDTWTFSEYGFVAYLAVLGTSIAVTIVAGNRRASPAAVAHPTPTQHSPHSPHPD